MVKKSYSNEEVKESVISLVLSVLFHVYCNNEKLPPFQSSSSSFVFLIE
jgi:hypothetical protein